MLMARSLMRTHVTLNSPRRSPAERWPRGGRDRLYLGDISATSRRHLGDISAASRRHLAAADPKAERDVLVLAPHSRALRLPRQSRDLAPIWRQTGAARAAPSAADWPSATRLTPRSLARAPGCISSRASPFPAEGRTQASQQRAARRRPASCDSSVPSPVISGVGVSVLRGDLLSTRGAGEVGLWCGSCRANGRGMGSLTVGSSPLKASSVVRPPAARG